ncbi:3-isopropylmalate dehydrogenase [Parvularcula sp. LCG005]|uniref:3-isopropylmalate dehydrogenase n=1 Tax=Parvularcula sp. LCG005 TaxID=3078805 RepID=UPI002941DFFC|nr:3-isopropylmalate dehydrogenase [Parvularcula sp. LCG005]WOI53108.1 3-isopropylmalate dehydrogenase [Parvularcula sp. LCG005]
MSLNVVLLPGDGIGPEVTEAAVKVLEAACAAEGIALHTESHDFGGIAIDRHGDPLPAGTLDACLSADAIFLGAVGGPKWDMTPIRPEQGLLRIRKELNVFANLRPLKLLDCLAEMSPLKSDRVRGTDILIVRELTGGLYFGDREEGLERATDSLVYTDAEVERVTRIAFEAAKGRSGRLTSVDKANVLASSRLWRSTVNRIAKDYPEVAVDHVLVDAMAMHLIQRPSRFDVVVTENLFGDILSDEASVIAGSIGLLGSASLGEGTRGLYEPIHGSAPDIAGKGKANPIGAIMSMAMLLRFSAGAPDAADRIEAAAEAVIRDHVRTSDLGGTSSTQQVADAVVEKLMAA